MSSASPRYVRLLAGLVRPFPNFDFGFIKPLRRRAADLLRLRAGDRVLDAGCGSGGSFPFLVEAVGPTGKVTGIEISPLSAAHARDRAAANRWDPVEVLVSAAEVAPLEGRYDGLLMFAAPDIFGSSASLRQLTRHLREGARVAFFGAKASARSFGWVLNGPMDFALRRLSLPTTPGLDAQPWRIAAEFLDELVVEESFNGWMFLASGTLRRS